MSGGDVSESVAQPSTPQGRGIGLLEVAFGIGAVLVVLVASGLTVQVGFERQSETSSDVPSAADIAPPSPPPVSPQRPPSADEASESAPVDVTVQILDGGAGEERTGEMRATLERDGFRVVATSNARPRDSDVIYFTFGFEEEALLVAGALGIDTVISMDEIPEERRLSSNVMVHVLAGSR